MNLQTAPQTHNVGYRFYRPTTERVVVLPDRPLPFIDKNKMAAFDAISNNKDFTIDGALRLFLKR
jgi:hypothetical protein